MSVHRPRRFESVSACLCGPGVSVIHDDLEHDARRHFGRYGPDFDPALSGWKYGARKAFAIFGPVYFSLRKTEPVPEKFGKFFRLGVTEQNRMPRTFMCCSLSYTPIRVTLDRVGLSGRPQTKPFGVSVERDSCRLAVQACSRAAITGFLEPSRKDPEGSFLPVRLEIESSHEPFAGENRQAVVSIRAFGRWFEYLQDLIEAEESFDTGTVPQERIEGRQQHADFGPGPDLPESTGERTIVGSNPTRCWTAFGFSRAQGRILPFSTSRFIVAAISFLRLASLQVEASVPVVAHP